MNADAPKPIPAETPEPQTTFQTPPVWLFIVLLVLLYWGMLYLDRHGGGFHRRVYEPYTSLAQVDSLQPGDADPVMVRGKQGYELYCQACHQPNGQGAAGMAPPLAGSEWVLTETPDRLISIILNGLTGPIMVKGTQWNLTMLAWRDLIDDEDVAAISTFVRANKKWGNTASPVTPEQVQVIRQQTAGRGGNPMTADELEKLPD